MSTKLRGTLLASLTAATLLTGIQASPAAAALPGLSCISYSGEAHCVANLGGQQSAGTENNTGRVITTYWRRTELVYYAFDQYPRGGSRVLAVSPYDNRFEMGEKQLTPNVTSWLPGVYCQRTYTPPQANVYSGYWTNFHCVDTNGRVR